jgi:hypothetical protein
VIVVAVPPEGFSWIKERLHLEVTPGFRAVAACSDDGEVLGMVGFDAWTENAVQMHVAIDDPGVMRSRRFVRDSFAYPFLQAKKGIIYTVTASDNERSLRFQRGLGFREAWRLQDGWNIGVDLVVMVMKRDECRWLFRKPVEA